MIEKLTIENIKQGDIFYDVSFDKITKYEYHCVYPYRTTNSYHLVLDRTNEKPIRWHKDSLSRTIDMNLKTYDEAKLLVIDNLESHANFLRSNLKESTEIK